MKIGISQCLVGCQCTYSASHNLVKLFKQMYDDGLAVVVCPEVLGGLPIPRAPAEIQQREPLRIYNNQGQDVTKEYVIGAKKALDIFLENDVKVAVLKFRSPSCGNDGVYDGTFSHRLIEGQGIFAEMLKKNGIQVFNENQINELLKYIGKEDDYGSYFKDSTSI